MYLEHLQVFIPALQKEYIMFIVFDLVSFHIILLSRKFIATLVIKE